MDPGERRQGWPRGGGGEGGDERGLPPPAPATARVAPAPLLPELLRPLPPPPRAAAPLRSSSSSSSSSRTLAALQRAPSAAAADDEDDAGPPFKDCSPRRNSTSDSSSTYGRAPLDPTKPPAPRPFPAPTTASAAAAATKPPPTDPQWPRWRARLLALLDNPWTTSLLLALTLFAILQEDCKYALLPSAEADVFIEAATAAAVAALLAEIALSSLVRPRFFLSFYFWLDTLAILSLGFEIPALRAALAIGPSGGTGLGDAWAAAASTSTTAAAAALAPSLPADQLPGFVDLGAAAPAAGLRAAGEQALVWAKAGRAVKVLRLVRALQQQRAWRQQRAARRAAAEAAAVGGGGAASVAAHENDNCEEEWYTDVVERYRYAEARVGHRLQELTVRRLAVGLLATVAALALLDAAGRGGPAFGAPDPAPGYAGLRMLHAQAGAAVGAALDREFAAAGVGLLGAEEEEPVGAGATAATKTLAVAAAAAANAISTPGFKAALAALSQTVEYNIGGRRGAFRPLLLVVANVTLVPWEGGGGGGGGGGGVGANGSSTATTTPTSTPHARHRRYLEVEGAVLRTQVCPASSLLPDPSSTFSPSPSPSLNCATLISAAMLDARAALVARSAAGVARTLLLAALLAAGSHLVQRDTRLLVLEPVERMVERVRAMSDDPLGAFAAKWGDGSAGSGAVAAAASEPPPRPPPQPPLLHRLLRLPPPSSSSSAQLLQQPEDPPGQYETRLLEDAIQRVCALLAVSFGEAGAAIVADNLRRGRGGGGAAVALAAAAAAPGTAAAPSSSSTSNTSFDPMVPGRRVVAVFGFCDIRRFTDAAEVLGEGVMEFVNAVAALAHGSAAARGGAPNKNVGDAFLLVWRLPRGLRPGDAAAVEEEDGDGAERRAGEEAGRSGGGGGGSEGAAASSAVAVGLELQGVAAALDAQRVASRALYAARPSSPLSSTAAGAAPLAPPAAAAASRFSRSSPSPSLLLAALSPLPRPSSSSSPRPPLRRSLLAAAAATVAAAAAASGGGGFLAGQAKDQPAGAGADATGARSSSFSAPPAAALEAARRSVLSCQDVRRLPLSPPAKAVLVSSVADGALAAFCLTRVAMAASARLRRYGERADLCARMAAAAASSGHGGSGNGAASHQPPPPYRVQMGFGLHVGWAIEGAIGSRHKVDASYLSPHVNLASRLEAATKQFGVPLLASRAFWACLSPAVRRRARLLDRVVVKGSAVPLEVYTYDLDVGAALEACGRGREGGKEGGDNGSNDDRGALALLERKPGDEWAEHPALVQSWRLTEAWKARFDMGVSAYLAGDWRAARAALEPCRVLPPRRRFLGEEEEGQRQEEEEELDGPTAVLLEIMAGHGFVAPAGWRGFRELTEK